MSSVLGRGWLPLVLATAAGSSAGIRAGFNAPDTDAVEVFQSLQIEPRRKLEMAFTAGAPPAGREAVLSLKARLQFDRPAGYNPSMRLVLNGQALDAQRLVNKKPTENRVDGRTQNMAAGDLITVSLRWDEPWGSACTDYDLELFGPDDSLVRASRDSQVCSGNPVESVQVLATRSGRYRARIVQAGSSGQTPRLQLLMLGSPDSGQPLDYFVTAGSLAEPADHPGVLTIGAEDPFDAGAVASFSSHGPTKDGRPKPDLVAPTGTATGAEIAFSGTSAATPHAAGAAALLFEAFPGAAVTDIMRELRERATPVSPVTAASARMLRLGALKGVGPVLPPGDGLASLSGALPEGAGIATLHYRGPDGFPARFAHLLLAGRAATAYYRLDVAGRTTGTFVAGAPRLANTFEVLNDGDVVLATFP